MDQISSVDEAGVTSKPAGGKPLGRTGDPVFWQGARPPL